ncbi:MAG: UDP-N-acetylmuramate--L-alanine ligase [Bacteroidales bacterium]|nr:UDP-N-acetylmuramate--L-alanine ligase [Bacteroidales bacterium]
MVLDKIRKIYFLGIGGIGMSALARYFSAKGIQVSGYDRTRTNLTDELSQEGMIIHFEDDPTAIPDDIELIIYTPAIPATLREFSFLKESKIPMLKRAEVTGLITAGKITVAVAGTHGKTSISSMIAHILKHAGFPVTALIGGISKNYDSNFITSGKEDIMVVEADEYDRSFLSLFPDIAVISSMDPDHLDIYGTAEAVMRSFSDFARNIKPGGKIIMRDGLPLILKPGIRRIDYAVEELADLFAANMRIEEGIQVFDMMSCGQHCKGIKIQIPGRHNIENALAAALVCESLGVDKEKILEGISTFSGVKRRFDTRIRLDDRVYIDDYAHHPRELEAFISAVRQLYPGKKLTGLFQPHLYSRTKDFAEGFAKSLDLLDEAWLLDIYPARELPVPGVTSEIILKLMHQKNSKLVSKSEVIGLVEATKPEVFLTMGAGDIDLLVDPITKILQA